MRTQNKATRGAGATGDFPRLLGGALCLDFANTVEAPRSHQPIDFLRDYADLARWCGHVRLLDDDMVDRLLAVAHDQPADAARVFQRAVALREATRAVFLRIAAGEQPRHPDLALIQREYAGAIADAQLSPAATHLAWGWDHRPSDLRRPLWSVAESAARLLTEGDLTRVRECPGAGDCGWLFYDRSPAGRRRWCSMEGCGSRVKMRRQYARLKGVQ